MRVVLGPVVCPGRPLPMLPVTGTWASDADNGAPLPAPGWVCSLVGLGRRGALTSALHMKSNLRPGAWGEGPKGPVP